MTAYRVRPSGLALTVACNASLQLQESVVPLPETDEEAEGHAAHWVARRFIAGYGHELPVGTKFHSGGRDWEVDLDMYTAAVMYFNALGGNHPDLHVEETIPIARVHYSECGGTPDAWRFFADARAAYQVCPPGLPEEHFYNGRVKLVRVGDFKYGHRYVEVFENLQLAPYASGVLDKLGLSELDESLFVELILAQPRSYHRDGPVRIWRAHISQLRNILNNANDAADRALMPLGETFAPVAKTGPHCLDCRARHVCETLQINTMRLVDFAHTAERVELPANALGQELAIVQDAQARLKARFEGLSAQAEALLRAGQAVPFYNLEPGQSKLAYFETVTADEIVGFGDLVGVDLRKPQAMKDKVVTPTQAIQLGIDENVMRSYAQRSPGSLRLARINPITARKVFSK